MLNFFKSRSTLKVKVTRSKLWYHVKGFVTSNEYEQYESPISYALKVTAYVKVFFFKIRSNFKVKVKR